MSGSAKEARTVSKGTDIRTPRFADAGEAGGVCGRQASERPSAPTRTAQVKSLSPSGSRNDIGISFSSSFRSGAGNACEV